MMLAWRLCKLGALADFDPYPMVRAAARYLIVQGCVHTAESDGRKTAAFRRRRWPANIAALVCASGMSRRKRGDEPPPTISAEYADYIESHVESLDRDQPRHPRARDQAALRPHQSRPIRTNRMPDEDPDHGTYLIHNRPPGER